MNQITSLNRPDQRSATASLRSSITKNFDTLRESLVTCSKIASQGEGNSALGVKKKIANLQTELTKTKESMKRQIKNVSDSTKR